MKQNQPICIELLNSFSDVELENFQHFINCPYFNTDKSIVSLFEALNKYVLRTQNFNEEIQKIVFGKVFGLANKFEKLTHKEKKHLNAKLSLLKKIAEQFLVIKGLQSKKTHFYDLLLEQLSERRQFKSFDKHIKQIEYILEHQQKDLNYYQLKKVLETYKTEYSLLTSTIYKGKNDLYELNYCIDSEYLLLKIRYYITMLSVQQTLKIDYDTSFSKSIDEIINIKSFKNNPPIIVGKATVTLLKYYEKKYYEHLLWLLKKYSKELTEDHIKYSFAIAINFCIRKIREGKMSYSDAFKLYEEMDNQNLLIEDKFVAVLNLKNYISAACRVNKFEKAKHIVEKYRFYINKADRDNVCNYNYGVIAFYEKNYNKALNYFIRADLGQDANLKVVILKCHYEMDADYDERTMQIFRSAQKFFKDNKQLTTVRKRSYRNFIQILIYIYKIKFNATKMVLQKVKEKLIAQDVNSDREWLTTKMDELIKI